jgi:hypothetical protein
MKENMQDTIIHFDYNMDINGIVELSKADKNCNIITRHWYMQKDKQNSCGIISVLNAHYFYNNDKTIFKKFKYLNKKYNSKNTGIICTDVHHMLYELGLVKLPIGTQKNNIEKVLNAGLPIHTSCYVPGAPGIHSYLIIDDWFAINICEGIKKINYDQLNFPKYFGGEIAQLSGVIIPKEFSLKNLENTNEIISGGNMWNIYYDIIYKKYKNTMYLRTIK